MGAMGCPEASQKCYQKTMLETLILDDPTRFWADFQELEHPAANKKRKKNKRKRQQSVEPQKKQTGDKKNTEKPEGLNRRDKIVRMLRPPRNMDIYRYMIL
jgi:hypothetical protein